MNPWIFGVLVTVLILSAILSVSFPFAWSDKDNCLMKLVRVISVLTLKKIVNMSRDKMI
jgi:hypothetical protein